MTHGRPELPGQQRVTTSRPWRLGTGMSTQHRAAAPTRALRLESLQDAADRLDVSVSTIRRLIADGKLTGYRLGNRILRINPEELDQTLQTTTAWAQPTKRGRRQPAWAD